MDLVTITLNGMADDYHMFITGLKTRDKATTFEKLTGILMQEEERWMNLKPQNADLALMAKKNPFRGKLGARWKEGGTPKEIHFKVFLRT